MVYATSLIQHIILKYNNVNIIFNMYKHDKNFKNNVTIFPWIHVYYIIFFLNQETHLKIGRWMISGQTRGFVYVCRHLTYWKVISGYSATCRTSKNVTIVKRICTTWFGKWKDFLDIAGSIMTIDDFYVDKSKEPLIELYKARVYKVFHVNIALCYDEDKLCTKICMSSADENGTSQNIKKAKVSKSC